MHRQNRIFVAAACWLAMFLVWFLGAWLVCNGPGCPAQSIDDQILRWFATIRTDWLDRFFLAATWAGSSIILLPLTVAGSLLLASRNRSREALFLVAAFIGASALTIMAKILVARPRPDLFPACCPIPDSPSFPSSHTAQIVAFVVAVLWIATARWRIVPYATAVFVGVLLILLVAVSRMYLQVHYLSDIIASILTATLWVAGVAMLILGGNSRES